MTHSVKEWKSTMSIHMDRAQRRRREPRHLAVPIIVTSIELNHMFLGDG